MKLNTSFPATCCQKLIEVVDECKPHTFYEKRMATEVAADALEKKGEKDIPGLTDTTVPYGLGPKRASRICKFFKLSKEDDVHLYAVRKPLNKE
ncbi:ribosomal protein s6-like, partial [Lynx pardinus]